MFDVCVDALAPRGRLIIIGAMSQVQRAKAGTIPRFSNAHAPCHVCLERIATGGALCTSTRAPQRCLTAARHCAARPRPPFPCAVQYAGGWAARQYPGIAEKLLWKSATLQGFFLLHYARDWGRHLAKLAALVAAGKLRVQVRGAWIGPPLPQDWKRLWQPGGGCATKHCTARHLGIPCRPCRAASWWSAASPGDMPGARPPLLRLQMDPRRFVGLESVADAVEHLQSGRSVGKVFVQVAEEVPATAAAAAGQPAAAPPPRARL